MGKEHGEETPHNSPIREFTAKPLDWMTGKIHDRFPDLTADEVTTLGLVGTAIAAGITLFRDKTPSSKNTILTGTSLGVVIASQLTDAVDGRLARLTAKEHPEKVNPNGQLVDVTSDRIQEMLLALTRAISAHQRSDTCGEWAAIGCLLTSPLPSLARAHAESQKKIVSETGHGPVEVLGTRMGRAVLSIIATEFPIIKNVPVQLIADGLATAANIMTTSKRVQTLQNPENPGIPEKIVNDAKKRETLLFAISAASTVVAGSYILFRQTRTSKK